MTAPLVLLAFALGLASVGSTLLRDARWTTRSPRAGIWAWQVLTASVATALTLATVSLALPLLPVRADLARLMGITPPEIVAHYLTPVGHELALAAAALAAGLVTRFTWCLGRALWSDHRARLRHADSLLLLGHAHPDGYLVVDHPAAAVYCLPGRRGEVVVTSRALKVLSPRQLGLVLGHERAHLRAHHQLPLVLAGALHRTFVLRVFATALEQIATLAEMQADDSARDPHDRRDLARALVALAEARRPAGSLTAGSVAATARVRRLVGSGDRGLRPPGLATLGLASAGLLCLPWILALVPAVEAGLRECCAPPAVAAAQVP